MKNIEKDLLILNAEIMIDEAEKYPDTVSIRRCALEKKLTPYGLKYQVQITLTRIASDFVEPGKTETYEVR